MEGSWQFSNDSIEALSPDGATFKFASYDFLLYSYFSEHPVESVIGKYQNSIIIFQNSIVITPCPRLVKRLLAAVAAPPRVARLAAGA